MNINFEGTAKIQAYKIVTSGQKQEAELFWDKRLFP